MMRRNMMLAAALVALPLAAAKAQPVAGPYVNLGVGGNYMQQWNVSVQRQLTAASALEVSYVGTKGTKLIAQRDINQARASAAQASRRARQASWSASRWSGSSRSTSSSSVMRRSR